MRRVALIIAALSLAGCRVGTPREPLVDRDPIHRIPAVARADRDEAVRLVGLLDDPDPAVRLAAAGRLREQAGDDFGYRFWESPENRAPAVARWRAWADGR